MGPTSATGQWTRESLTIPNQDGPFDFAPFFPVEIVHHIFGMCTPADLTRICLTQKLWRHLARHVLEKNPRIRLNILCSSLFRQLHTIPVDRQQIIQEVKDTIIHPVESIEKFRQILTEGYRRLTGMLDEVELETQYLIEVSRLPGARDFQTYIDGIRNRKLEAMLIVARADDFQGDLAMLIRRICRLGLVDKAKELVAEIHNPRTKSDTETEVVKTLLETNSYDEAESLALSIPQKLSTNALQAVHETFIRNNLLDRGFHFVMRMQHGLAKSFYLRSIASARITNTQLDKAFETAKAIEKIPLKLLTLKELDAILNGTGTPLETEVKILLKSHEKT